MRRNRVKRLLREFFRLHQEYMPRGADIVAVPKKHLNPDALALKDLEQELLPVLTGLFKRAAGKNGRDTNAARD